MATAVEFGPDIMRELDFSARAVRPRLREDARQEAALAVLQALPRFDPARGACLRTFVSARARGAVLDFCRRSDPLSRQHRKKVRDGDAEEVIVQCLDKFAFRIRDKAESQESLAVSRSIAEETIRSLWRLNRRELYVVTEIFWGDRSQKDLSEELGCHESWVSHIKIAALRKLREALPSDLIRARS